MMQKNKSPFKRALSFFIAFCFFSNQFLLADNSQNVSSLHRSLENNSPAIAVENYTHTGTATDTTSSTAVMESSLRFMSGQRFSDMITPSTRTFTQSATTTSTETQSKLYTATHTETYFEVKTNSRPDPNTSLPTDTSGDKATSSTSIDSSSETKPLDTSTPPKAQAGDDPSRIAGYHNTLRHLLGHHRASPDEGMGADDDTGQDRCVSADLRPRLHRRSADAVLIPRAGRVRIIRKHHARPEEHMVFQRHQL